MTLNKLENFIRSTDGRIIFVNPSDINATDAITNDGTSLASPFKTIQRALVESARFSYQKGNNNDLVEKTTILLFPGEHLIDNRPGYAIYDNGETAYAVSRAGGAGVLASSVLSLGLDSNFDLTQEDNILYKFNSYYGGVVVPRGTSIVGLDLRKTKIRPKYVPNPTDDSIGKSAIFRITGACYFWQFSIFDADPSDLVYTNPDNFGLINQSTPNFSHHKLTCFEFCDGVNNVDSYGLTDLDMYYSKVSNAYNAYREIDQQFPSSSLGFAKRNSEWEIVGAFASDPIEISSIISGNGSTASALVTVTTKKAHGLNAGTPVKIRGVSGSGLTQPYNISTTVQSVVSSTSFTYLLPAFESYITLNPNPSPASATVTIETDTVSGASPYIFNCSLRSVWGMNGLHADGSKASGFRSTVVAQFTAISLQKDDRAFVKYDKSSRTYQKIDYTTVSGSALPEGASQTDSSKVYHLDPEAIYRKGWETSHIKFTNDAFIQIVSVFAIGFNKHFDAESGGDASITNSNSNFGQISLNSSGFKKEAFDKDNTSFITSVIPPRAIPQVEDNIEWLSLNVGLTTQVGISSHLYLYGFNSSDNTPSTLTQGYRIGARLNDKLYVKLGTGTSEASIYMCDNAIHATGFTTALGSTSSVKSYRVTSGPSSNSFTIGVNGLLTGEKVKIISDDGDLPENIDAHETYYAINNGDNNTVKLASSYTNAIQSQPITVYGGTNLTILSRVSDKESGELGSPIQFDAQNKNWFIHVNPSNQIYNALASGGTATYGETTELAYVKRISDERSLDEKLYKFRVVIPKETVNGKDPESGFVIQESSTTGVGNSTDFTRVTIGLSDFNSYFKNPRFISTCSESSGTVTVISELPHNLQIGEIVILRNIKSSTNTTGIDNVGYNGRFEVTSIVDANTFRYSTTDVTGIVHSVGTFTDTTASRDENLPRFERNDWQGNLYVYRNEIISPYIYNQQDGIYHVYVLNSNNTITDHFTNLKYSQPPTNLYPQLDRDNVNANPPAAKTFAKRSPIGEVVTNDLKSSITRESADLMMKEIGIGLTISTVISTSGIATISFSRFHGLSGIVTGSITPGASYSNGTYYNVKLLNDSQTGSWSGATAKVVVSGGAVTSSDIMSPGSGYTSTELYFDQTRIGAGNGAARYNITTSGISTNIGDVVQITGDGTTSDGYYRIVSVASSTSVAVAKTSGDPTITTSQYAFVVGPSVQIQSVSTYDSATGISTFYTTDSHGLLSGHCFRVVDSSNNNLGDYLVKDRLGITSFTAVTNKTLSAASGYILKHGLSSNDAISDTSSENLGTRQITFYDSETFKLSSAITTETTISITSSGIGTAQRLPLGSYIQIDNEIMRIASSNNTTSATVLRGVLGTRQESHDVNSQIRKINPIAVEFRRPSIVRASGHTFEYLGYGPGNYSTGLPQVQVRSLSDTENFLANSQERSCGVVVYTGMNNSGDFYNGNTKTSATSGEVVSYDIPNPTVTGENPNKLSAVFDEVTIKERLLVEGGDSGQVLSQFNGPVTFNKEIRAKSQSTFSDKVRITNAGSDSLTVTGGSVLNGEVIVNTGIVPDSDEGAYLGTSAKPFSDAHIGEIRIAQTDDNTIDTATGNLTINATTGSSVAIQTNTTISGNLDLTGSPSGSGRISANYLDVPNVTPIGGIIMWTGSITNFPVNWLLCNGQAISRTTYSELFAIIGTTYGVGDNSTTFNLPNLLERFVVGAGGDNPTVSGTTGYNVGQIGGDNSIVLNREQMPVHNHPATCSDQFIYEVRSAGAQSGGSNKVEGTFRKTPTISIGNTGGLSGVTQGHENRPPYIALPYIIRVR